MARGFDTESNLCPAFAPFMLMLQYHDKTSPNIVLAKVLVGLCCLDCR